MTEEQTEPTIDAAELNYPSSLRLTLSDANSMFEEARELAEAFERGEETEREATRAFRDINDLRELLTDRRIEILRSIAESPPDSISDLAGRLDRTYSLVHDDVAILAEHDIVHFREGSRRAKQPYIPYETIRVDIPLVGTPVTAQSIGIQSTESHPQTDTSGESNEDENKEQWLDDAIDPRSESHS
jgi:predicted transcriptional regulator